MTNSSTTVESKWPVLRNSSSLVLSLNSSHKQSLSHPIYTNPHTLISLSISILKHHIESWLRHFLFTRQRRVCSKNSQSHQFHLHFGKQTSVKLKTVSFSVRPVAISRTQVAPHAIQLFRVTSILIHHKSKERAKPIGHMRDLNKHRSKHMATISLLCIIFFTFACAHDFKV